MTTSEENKTKEKRRQTLVTNLLCIEKLTGMKGYEICTICNIQDSNYSRLKNGTNKSMDPTKLEPLCTLVHITVEELHMDKNITAKYIARKEWQCKNYDELWEMVNN